uniref:Succinate dehydrogenase subunit 3 n=1 Tax=Gredgaria maugeana TaxID=2007213 RepID=UPI0022FDAD0A|nr:Succinate dehydrogenase subunit 3 [Gredgaria maugeana]WAX04211.1 Succinate dehydrogenase subunit 3 [Gredgaria maugeana]
MFFYYVIKPFSPHLTIYKNQLSSFFSILHRLAAITLLIFLICLTNFYLITFNIFVYNFLFLNKFFYFLFLFFIYFSIKLGFFHLINGLKGISISFLYLQTSINLNMIQKIIFGVLIFIFIFF